MSDDAHRMAAQNLVLLERTLRGLARTGAVLVAVSLVAALLLRDPSLAIAGAFLGVGALAAFRLERRARRALAATRVTEVALLDGLKREQEALADAAATASEYRFLVDSIPQLVWTATRDGAIDYCNQSWIEYTWLSLEETCANGWSSVLHPDDADRCSERWQASIRSGEPYEVVCRLRTGVEGPYRWFLGRAVPLRNAAGEIVKWFGTCTDIDDQKRINEQLAEADRRKDEFLATLGHELRNPLAPILTAVQLSRLKEGDPRALQRQHEIIERQVRHMVRLVDDLLDISRISRGKIQLRTEPVDLMHVVARAVEAASTLIERRAHGLSIDLPRRSLRLQADAVRVEQILFNLLQNAAKYTDPGGRIALSARVIDGSIELRVRDTGIGISPENLDRVFQPFEQVTAGDGYSRGGIGIGLALVKGLVELHGGTIGVTSAGVGRGTEFTLRLPGVIEANSSEPVDDGLATVTPFPMAASEPAPRVLVVDDNADAADSLGEALQGEGYDVRVVYDGATALRLARDFAPRAIVLDVGMPELDGYEVARRLRQMPELAHTLLIALTGFGQESDQRRARHAGFDEHLVKPADLETLFSLIRERSPRAARTLTA